MRRAALALLAAATLALSGPSVAAPARRSAESLTERNRAIVTDFARLFYTQRDVRAAFDRYVAPGYIQHNPGIADGRDAAVAALVPMFARPGSRFEVKRIVVDGDIAVIHLHGRSGAIGAGGAVADIYRLRAGRIVEHWDVLQPMPTQSANPHPMF